VAAPRRCGEFGGPLLARRRQANFASVVGIFGILCGNGTGSEEAANPKSEGGARMTLPKKDEKGYLQVQRAADRPSIVGQSQHIAELAALFEQHGIGCRRVPATPGTEDMLLFDPDADMAALKGILEAYQSAKGS